MNMQKATQNAETMEFEGKLTPDDLAAMMGGLVRGKLIFDLGGGTFDVSLLTLDSDLDPIELEFAM